MKIDKVEIKDFRCHSDLIFEPQKIHSIVGENGTGKTALLEAILYATSPLVAQNRIKEQDFCQNSDGDIFIRVTFDRYFVLEVPDGFVSQYLACKSVACRIKRRSRSSPGKLLSSGHTMEHYCIPTTYENRNVIDTTLLPEDFDAGKLPEEVSQRILGQDKIGYEIKRKSMSTKEISPAHLSLSNKRIGFPHIFYFDKKREGEIKSGFNTLLGKITDDLNWRYVKDGNPETHLEAWESFYASVVNSVVDQKKDKILKPVLTKLKSLIGEAEFNLELSILNVSQPFSKAFLSKRHGINQIGVDGLGSGVSMLISYSFLEHVSQLSKESVIFLVDEPEIHLHPQWQKKLNHEIREAQAQTILSSHSPYFIDLTQWGAISRLSKGKIHPSLEILGKVINGKPLETYLNEFQQNRKYETVFYDGDTELFFAKKVLLVEGPAEKYGIPLLAQYLGHDFSDMTIISCNGKTKIRFYAMLCRAFEIPTFTLFDLDQSNNNYDIEEKPKNEQLLSCLEELNFYTFENSFESSLGIGKNADSKCTKTLEKIDDLISQSLELPADIKKALSNINAWGSGQLKPATEKAPVPS